MNEKEFNNIPERDRKNRVLEGKSYYACLHKPNMTAVKKFNGDPAYIINVLLDDENLALAEEFGLRILEENEYIPGPHVKVQRKIKPPRTAETVKIPVVDSMQKPLPTTMLIGNESLVRIKFGTRWATTGPVADLYKVQVRKLIPFEMSEDKAFVMDEEGFTVGEDDDSKPPFDTDDKSTDTGEISFDD